MSTPRQSRSWIQAAGTRIRSRALDAPFGAELAIDAGADLRAEEGEALRALFADHGLLVVRGREISREEQIAWVSALGRLEPDASGQPMEMEVTNQHDQSTAPPGELIFHYDYAYDPQPIPAISMYGLLVDGADFSDDLVVVVDCLVQRRERQGRNASAHGPCGITAVMRVDELEDADVGFALGFTVGEIFWLQ